MKKKQADLLGITSAILCIIHCLLVPLFVVYGIVSDSFAEKWEYLDWGFILLSSLAVYLANRHEYDRGEDQHRGYIRQLPFQMWVTWLVFTIALLLHDSWKPALYISVFSSLGLAWLHLQHFRKKHIATIAE